MSIEAITDTELSSDDIPEIVVRSQRYQLNALVNDSLSTLTSAQILAEAPKHPNELLNQIPGTWVSKGSGQEHLTAIRSPVLTGAGACGSFMVLEDNVPTRPSGFCNVNQLFEVNFLQAERVDVLRGPGTVTYGSNALHGAISVFTPGPASSTFQQFGIEAGSYDYFRGSIALSIGQSALQANYTDSGSFRDDESYRHGLLNYQIEHKGRSATGRTSFAYADLDQQTAGYIYGKDAYKDETLRTQNLNPEAYREATAARLSSRWNLVTQNNTDLEFIPYIRSSRMEFLQHFLPGTPLENNGQDSAGLLFSWSINPKMYSGIDLEWASGELVEYQENPVEDGSSFLKETRPQGYHYDYSASALTVAGWIQWKDKISRRTSLTAGLRVEYVAYNYNNRMLDGNTRDDGTECGFGGCLYTRPSDRHDSYNNVSPEIGLEYDMENNSLVYLRAARGYRAPQATELYRLQNGQEVADLSPETLDTLELGLKGISDRLSYDFAAYLMYKKNFIFRDADGYNISDGKTKHSGLELNIQFQATESLLISTNVSWARHLYNFDRVLARGEIIKKGNEIDTAPAWLGSLRFKWQAKPDWALEADWVYQGAYFLDASNMHQYDGHNLVNLRAWMALKNTQHRFALRLNNILDTRYAERADFAFGNYRYFPGAGRVISLEWLYRRQ